jgi:hypothetical protein
MIKLKHYRYRSLTSTLTLFVSIRVRCSELTRCCHNRITLDEVLNHPWVVEGMPTAVTVQRRSRKRRGSIMSASPEDSGSPRSTQAPKEGRKKRKEGSSRKTREEEPAVIQPSGKPEAGIESEEAAKAVKVEAVPPPEATLSKDFMAISAGDLTVLRAAVEPQILNDDEELATGGTESPVVSDLGSVVATSPRQSLGLKTLQQRDDDITGSLSGDLEKLKLSREFPAYSKVASVRDAAVPVPPLRSFSSPVVQF